MNRLNDRDVVAPQKVQALHHFKRLVPLFQRLHEVGTKRDIASNRTLFMDDYCLLVTLFLFNPMIDSIAMCRRRLKCPRSPRRWACSRSRRGVFPSRCVYLIRSGCN